jgi:hypothetical protein
MSNPSLFNEEVGLLKLGSIVSYDSRRGLIKVQLSSSSAINGKPYFVDVPAPHTMFYNNGMFIGTLPGANTPVIIGQGSGGQHYFVSFVAEKLSNVPELKLNQLLIQANKNTKISLDTSNDIYIGSDTNKLHINAISNLYSSNFYNNYQFTQASRKIDGIVKRDLLLNTNYDHDSKLESDRYDSRFTIIGLDPSLSPSASVSGTSKNPPFVEQREIIYEFQYSSNIENDLLESSLYGKSDQKFIKYDLPDRRKSRADTLSLTLSSPNYLIETVKGTVIDIFGNILDLNRVPLPIGKDKNTIRSDKTDDKISSYFKIKELERKSLAYHFEINSRKDLSGNNGQVVLPDINSNEDYGRNRSRFFIDIDKEGQFKINVPASSSKGNIPLLTRYENYSSFGPEDNGNPNKLIYREDNLDIFQDSFASSQIQFTGDNPSINAKVKGSISIKDNDADGAPLDRILNTHIKHGTAYHDILKTCYAHQTNDFLKYQTDSVEGNEEFLTVNIEDFNLLENVVTDTIKVSGKDANAGGRSGSINFDGSIDLNIGANDIDRQSLWLDTAGGIVANIGRDLKSMSAALSMNGDVFFQVGGIGVSGDSRFVKEANGQLGAVLDIRVFSDGIYAHLIRLDKNGITIMTPGKFNLHSTGPLSITCGSDCKIDAETLYLQGRMVLKELGGTI